MVADRYRIVGLQGRGGMGEVYRADDLKLGQSVALKFLPRALADNPDRVARFLNEVKIARQVSHPNVCRVYDVGETGGQHYLSMEYVDGEDLAALLRRIGHLPEDKAVEIARQLCAGLAAAHEMGVLHRDLKPANVMLDGRGRAKLTDFGLAGLAEACQGKEARAGTPRYMAPEQLTGKDVTVRSDVYSLGLLLYELFTGRRVFDGGSMAELMQQQLDSRPPSPSSFMRAFDPAIERVLLQCLEKDPSLRPSSALAVAAALPGGDPLAAALAAGETPSPEMVAAAGPRGGLHPGVAAACLACVVAFWVLGWFPSRAFNPYEHLPLVKSFQALKENARSVAERLGYEAAPRDSWAELDLDIPEYFYLIHEYGPAGLPERMRQSDQTVLRMRYRQADEPITPTRLDGRVTWSTPAPSEGEVALEIDVQGRLITLRATPSWTASQKPSPPVDWASVFDLAGLDLNRFAPAEPTMRPPTFVTERRAWTGRLPGDDGRPIRIEATALDGEPVSFHRIPPSSAAGTPTGAGSPRPTAALFMIAMALMAALGIGMVAGVLFVAARNLRLGRGDRQGASRIAAFVFTMRTLHWIVGGDHVSDLGELRLFVVAISGATMLSLLAWIVYVACEPYVRRLWPEALVSWTRVLAGRLADPLVGRDVLIGCTFASIQGLVLVTAIWLGARTGLVGLLPLREPLIMLRGGRFAVGELFSTVLVSTSVALGVMAFFLLLRLLCRRTWIAAAVFCLLSGLILGATQFASLFGPQAALFGLVLQAFNAAVSTVLLVRYGLLALVASWIFARLGALLVFTLNTTAPYFGLGLMVTAVAFAIAIYGWRISVGARPAGRDLLAR
jgi:hypothetical protein